MEPHKTPNHEPDLWELAVSAVLAVWSLAWASVID